MCCPAPPCPSCCGTCCTVHIVLHANPASSADSSTRGCFLGQGLGPNLTLNRCAIPPRIEVPALPPPGVDPSSRFLSSPSPAGNDASPLPPLRPRRRPPPQAALARVEGFAHDHHVFSCDTLSGARLSPPPTSIRWPHKRWGPRARAPQGWYEGRTGMEGGGVVCITCMPW